MTFGKVFHSCQTQFRMDISGKVSLQISSIDLSCHIQTDLGEILESVAFQAIRYSSYNEASLIKKKL